jgi:hypothetical protein
MKHIAAEKLLSKYPDAEARVEHSVADGERRADVLVEFASPSHPLGRGIAVEVQYRHSQKSILRTTADYLCDGFSVMWLTVSDYEGSSPDFDDVHLTDALPVWPYAVPHPSDHETDTGTPPSPLGLTEQEVLPHLDAGAIGQQSLAAFTTEEPATDQADAAAHGETTPEWSLERRVSLSLSPDDVATAELVSTLLEAILQQREQDPELRERAQQYQESAAASDRDCHVSEWFRGGDRDGFEIEVLMTADGIAQELSIENRRQGHCFRIPTTESISEVFTDLVTAVVTELFAVRERTPSGHGTETVWSHVFEAGRQPVVCTVERTQTAWVELSVTQTASRRSPEETLRVQFFTDDIEALVSLCARVRIHEQ